MYLTTTTHRTQSRLCVVTKQARNRHQLWESTLLPGDEIMIGLTSLRVSPDDSEPSDCWDNDAAMA